MGQQTNKYHVSDDGTIYRINEDGSFTQIGNAENINQEQTEIAKHDDIPQMPYTVYPSSNDEDDEDMRPATLKDYLLFIVGIILLSGSAYYAMNYGIVHLYIMLLGASLSIKGSFAINKWLCIVDILLSLIIIVYMISISFAW